MFQGTLPGTLLPAFVLEIFNLKKTGTLRCKFEGFEKRINFSSGKITSASSTLIDDRLGEIIYREGKLSLDAFADTAGKVTKEARFGDLLIKRSIFTAIDLWNALKSQSINILTSLCFYDEVGVEFEEHDKPTKMELPIQFEQMQIFSRALKEREEFKKFEAAGRKNPQVVLNLSAMHLIKDDFQRDMVSLIQDNPDFNKIVDSTSRLSPTYTIRALYQLFLMGIIQDTWQLARQNLEEEIQKALQQTIEDANFMLAELANAAKMEEITEWESILLQASEVLSKDLGPGVFITASEGFLESNIFVGAIFQDVIRSKYFHEFSQCWQSSFVHQVQEALYASILFILFELYNRKFNSIEFARVKVMIDAMRNS